MHRSHIRFRLRQQAKQIASKTGRLILFFALLQLALIGSFLGTAVFFGLLQAPDASLFGHFRTWVAAANAVMASFDSQQSTFMVLLTFMSLLLGASAHWMYHQIVRHAGAAISRIRRSRPNLQ